MSLSRHSVSLLFAATAAFATLLSAAPASAQMRCPPGFSRNRWGGCAPARRNWCPSGYFARDGMCLPMLPPPAGNPRRNAWRPQPRACPAGSVFFNGGCVPYNQPHTACPDRLALIDGRCVPVNTPPTACPAGLELITGRCVLLHDRVPGVCPAGQFYTNGNCQAVEQPTQSVCPLNTVLSAGHCIPIAVPSQRYECVAGYAFVNGTCMPVAAPSQPVVCPNGWRFFRGRCRPN